MQAEQVTAFRLARSGLVSRDAGNLAEAAACPASDFARDSALFALAARREELTRKTYEQAVDQGELVVVAHIIRGAIHVLAAADFGLYGRALVATDDDELGAQLGRQFQQLAVEKDFAPTEALDEVAQATTDALGDGRALTKNELHDELRRRVSVDLMPWCKGCESHHVAPMLWRYGTVVAGARLDSQRRYVLGRLGRIPPGVEAVRRFLRFYGPAAVDDFGDWAGVAKPHASRLWQQVEGELSEIAMGSEEGWVLRDDAPGLYSPPEANGIRLIPPGDPYLSKPNRSLLAPEVELRKRLFRPVASPGAVLKDGRLAGVWRVKAKGKKAEITVEKLGRLTRADLEPEVQRIADLRGAAQAALVLH